ncbi:hypothetical protein [Muriicola sp.]|uniref:hypothetical protein n=1 Tax=Muriicola sp. TaxID=2020856 RepID=UPI003C7607EC
MKGLITYLWLSFSPLPAALVIPNACDYAGSNISYIRTQTQKALQAQKLNMVHYYAYKALNAIDKSKQQFKDCGCEYAQQSIEEGENNLKKAIKVTSLLSSRMLLEKALEDTQGSLEALQDHTEIHLSEYGNNMLAMNTADAATEPSPKFQPTIGKKLEARIDSSLLSFQNSLSKVVRTVECEEAQVFVMTIFERCELELLKENLTEGKRYYNLRTKEIAGKALQELTKNCPD